MKAIACRFFGSENNNTKTVELITENVLTRNQHEFEINVKYPDFVIIDLCSFNLATPFTSHN